MYVLYMYVLYIYTHYIQSHVLPKVIGYGFKAIVMSVLNVL